jgi:spore maturation protein CgeB
LIPDEHYFSLHSDYSNIEEVIDNFKNDKLRIAITENAFSHVLEHHTYDKRIAQILKIIFKI